MNSRKKVTIAFVSILLVLSAVIVALVSVLAASSQTVNSGFTVSYSASGEVVADVAAGYQIWDIKMVVQCIT